MATPGEFEQISRDWLDQLEKIDTSLHAGQQPDVSIFPEKEDSVRRLLSNLREMHTPARTPTPPPHPAGLPDQIGRYEVRRFLGAGGFAVVYLAYDPRLDREVAIKIPLPPGLLNPDARQRFIQEARLAAQLDHPHIVPAYEAGEDGSIPFIAYSYCSGPTLSQWIGQHGPMASQLAAELLADLADAVAYSHERGILHRDLKPANVLLFPSDRSKHPAFPFIPRLSDFGLAKLMETVAANTGSSVILGTPLYMAPEQIEAVRSATPAAADVYGLGGILFEALTGRPPFSGETVIQVLEAIRNGRVQKVRDLNPIVPADLEMICEKALAAVPEDRYPSAGELRDDLRRFVRGEKIAARSLGLRVHALRALQDPLRIREASGYVIASSIALSFWTSFWVIAAGLKMQIAHGMTMAEQIPYTVPLVLLSLFTMTMGFQISKYREWAAAFVTIQSAFLASVIVSILARLINPFYPKVYANEQARDIVYLLLFSFFAMQTYYGASAWLAIRRHRKRYGN